MATINELKELALHAARGTAPANFTAGNVDDALRGELNKMCDSINNFMRNRYDIYDIIITTVDEVVPNKVIDAMGMFAEVKQVAQGQKALFKRGNVGRNRAKKFLTQVGLSGLYESFRLDNSTFELGAYAIGGSASIDFERMLDGSDNMADLMDIVTEGMTDAAFGEVQKCLIAAKDAVGRPTANMFSDSNYNADHLFSLVNTVKAYGGNAVIFACPEFIGKMGPDAIVPGTVNVPGVYHPQDIDAIHNSGYVTLFRGTPIVQIPQSYIDDSNTKTWINPRFAYILPTGKEKVVKVVFEGQTQIYDLKNPDNSMEIHTYKKMGAAIITHNNWAIYENKSIVDTSEFPYGI